MKLADNSARAPLAPRVFRAPWIERLVSGTGT
jgi:hypothetical protein